MFGVVQLRYDDFHPGSLIPQSSTNTKTMCGAVGLTWASRRDAAKSLVDDESAVVGT